MARLIVFIIVAAALASVSVWLANNPGSVVIDWQGRQINTSVGIAILAVLAVGVALIVLFEVYRLLAGLPSRLRRSRAHDRELRGYKALTTGMVAAAAGNIKTADALYAEAERLLPQRGSVLLLAAQTAQLEGQEDVAHLKFRQMLRSRETELLGLRGLLAQAMRTNDTDEALSLARRAYKRSPTTPWVLTTLFDLLTRVGRWGEALNVTREMAKQGILNRDEANGHLGALHHLQAKAARDANQPAEALHHVRKGTKAAPGFAPGAALGAEVAAHAGKPRLARSILEDAWKTAPHPDVAAAYGKLVERESPSERLERFSSRLGPLRPDHPELHAALGELALAAQDWGRARTELQRAAAIEPTTRVCRLMAELERAQGNEARAAEWLAQALDAKPDHAWVCDDTGETLPAWRPVGPSGRFGSVHWAVPPRVATMQDGEHGGGPFLVADAPAAAPPVPGLSTEAPKPPPPPAADETGTDGMARTTG